MVSTRSTIKCTLLGLILISVWAPNAASSRVVETQSLEAGEILAFQSKVLNEERLLLVRLPEGYDNSKQRYPVLFLLDAEYFFRATTAAVQFLSECGYVRSQPMIPQLIVVGIVNVDRDRDFTPTRRVEHGPMRFPTSGRADRFLDFLEREVIPIVNERYRAQPYRILSGWSLGGLFTVHVALTRPKQFSAYLAVSPSLWWDDQIVVRRAERIFENGKALSVPLTVTLGSLEGGDMGDSVRDSFVPLLSSHPDPEGFFVFLEIVGEGHGAVPFRAWFEGLRALYADWRAPQAVLDGGPEAIRKFFEILSARYGYSVGIPEQLHSTMVGALYDQGEESEALELAATGAKLFSWSSEAHRLLGRVHQAVGELEKARDSYSRALQIIEDRKVPYSERRKAVEPRLRAVERELAREHEAEARP